MNAFTDLFKGLGPLACRQWVAWVFFLQADLIVRTNVRKIYQIPDNQNIPSKILIPASTLIAVMSTIIIMPFDNLKTQQQLWSRKFVATENISDAKGNKKAGYLDIIKNVYK